MKQRLASPRLEKYGCTAKPNGMPVLSSFTAFTSMCTPALSSV